MNYKVGDRVIVVKTDRNDPYYKIGEVFSILEMSDSDFFRGQSECPSYGNGHWAVGYDEVAPYSLLLEQLLGE